MEFGMLLDYFDFLFLKSYILCRFSQNIQLAEIGNNRKRFLQQIIIEKDGKQRTIVCAVVLTNLIPNLSEIYD